MGVVMCRRRRVRLGARRCLRRSRSTGTGSSLTSSREVCSCCSRRIRSRRRRGRAGRRAPAPPRQVTSSIYLAVSVTLFSLVVTICAHTIRHIINCLIMSACGRNVQPMRLSGPGTTPTTEHRQPPQHVDKEKLFDRQASQGDVSRPFLQVRGTRV